MSGLDIAGLVLGAIGFIITALDDNSPVGTVFRGLKDESNLRSRYTTRAKLERHCLRAALKQLLEPVTTKAQLQEMLARPECSLWSSTVIKEQLVQRDPESFVLLAICIQNLDRDLRAISDMLGTRATKSQGTWGKWQTVKFSLRVRMIENQWARIRSDREDLQACLRTQLRSNQDSRVSVPQLSTLAKKIQAEATVLSEAGSRACNCRSSARHRMNVLLEDRLVLDRSPGPTAGNVAQQNRYECSWKKPIWSLRRGEIKR